MKMKFNLQEINSLEILQNLSEEVFVWLIDHGERLDLLERDHMFTSGKPADYMYIVVNGLVHRYSEIGGQWLVVATTAPGQVTGMLPFSRMTHYPGHAIAAEPSKVLRLHKKNFIEMLGVSEELDVSDRQCHRCYG